MSTIYTLNGKVLKNSATDKWLAKKEAPAGFVMNASNVVYHGVPGSTGENNYFAIWEGPYYPAACSLEGKTIQLIVKEALTNPSANFKLMYAMQLPSVGSQYGGPNLCGSDFIDCSQPGTYDLTCIANAAPAASGYGTYITVNFKRYSSGDPEADLAKIEFRIID